jgi:hypothetical protein
MLNKPHAGDIYHAEKVPGIAWRNPSTIIGRIDPKVCADDRAGCPTSAQWFVVGSLGFL